MVQSRNCFSGAQFENDEWDVIRAGWFVLSVACRLLLTFSMVTLGENKIEA